MADLTHRTHGDELPEVTALRDGASVDLAVRIPRAVLQRGQDGDFDPAAFEGRKVRVRGWLAYEGRPIIELDDPSALEALPGRKSTKRP